MGHGAISVFNVTFASAGTFSNEVDLSRAWTKVYVDPTGAGAEVRFLGASVASAAGGVYRQIYLPQPASTSTVQTNIWKIGSAASGGFQEAPAGVRFMKLELTAAISNGGTLKLICSD